MLSRVSVVLAVLVFVLGVVAGATAEDQTVMALSGPNRFASNDVTVEQGETVTWKNGGGTHNVQFNDGSYEQPANPSSSSWTVSRTFNTVGDFSYICRQHGTAMSGIVHVVAAPPGGGPPEPAPGAGGSPGSGPGGPAPGGEPGGGQEAKLKISFKASDTTPLAGKKVRLFGVVSPAHDGAKLRIQKRLRNGKFKTLATTRLHAAAGDRSTFSIKLELSKDVVLRATLAGSSSKVRKLDVRAHR
jgi:plastocyanin